MHYSVYVVLLAGALFGATAPTLSRRLAPATATWLLSAGGLAVSVATTAALGFLGLTLVGQLPLLGRLGHWSEPALRRHDPVSASVAAIALLALLFLAVRVAAALARAASALRESHRVAAELPAHGGELAVIDSTDPAAYAVPGRPGRIVVSTGLLRLLNAGERRAVLAHERAHLGHHHHLHHSAAAIAAAANPLLVRLPEAVAVSCERWADEVAAASCPRQVVADALTRAGTGGVVSVNPLVLAGVVDVAARVTALRSPAPRIAAWRVALVGLLLAAVTLPALDAGYDVNSLFEGAQAVYHCGAASCR
jgi:hypothetical protein